MVKCLCGKYASFNSRDEKKARFCAEHKTPNMVNVKLNACEICDKLPSFNIRGETRGRFCVDHKTPEMVNVKSKTCELCEKQPVYNIRGETRGRFCVDHKTPEMINVKSKTCELCEKQPIYNISGKTNGRFCVEHKAPEMINVINKTCELCAKRPNFNIRGEAKGRFCVEHKTPEMVDVKNKTCELCDKLPSFNVSGETKGRFCADHKTLEMVNVKDKTCDLCETISWYGWLGKGKSHCASHKQKGMITSPNRKCETACCKQLGTHEANGMRYCEDHMPVGADNLGIETCTSCGLDDILTNGKCGTCDPHVIQTRRHVKENRVKDHLTVNGIPHIHDKILEGTSCGRERPDFQIDCGSHYVYIEVDEHQHQSYACECEQGRMVNLVEVRGMPVRWIRYNPDVYEPIAGQRKVKIEQREKKLIEYTKWAMNHSPQEDGHISNVLYLFYNDYDTKSQEWQKLI